MPCQLSKHAVVPKHMLCVCLIHHADTVEQAGLMMQNKLKRGLLYAEAASAPWQEHSPGAAGAACSMTQQETDLRLQGEPNVLVTCYSS
jgi:hypothetical protein